MAKMNVRGLELDFNPLNARHIELMASSRDKMAKYYDKIKDVDPTTMDLREYAKWLKKACDVIISVFDDVFGEGTVDKLNLDRDDFTECFAAFEELQNGIEEAGKAGDFVKYLNDKYAPVPNESTNG